MKLRIGLLLFMMTLLLNAAENAPHLGYVYPTGQSRGTTATILLGGQYFTPGTQVLIDGDGIKVLQVTPVPRFPNPDGKQRQYLQKYLIACESGTQPPELPADTSSWQKNKWWQKLDNLNQSERDIVIRDLYTKRNALQAAPAIQAQLLIDLEIAPDAEPGAREIRLYNNFGVSNPKVFYVDQYSHQRETELNAQGQLSELPNIENLPVILDGRIFPGESDRYQVSFNAGQSYEIALQGRFFQPFIGDAVPGHFQPIIEIITPQGQSIRFVDDEYFNPDPAFTFKPPVTGVYTVVVRDNLYRGRADFVYRLLLRPGQRQYPHAPAPFPELKVIPGRETIAINRKNQVIKNVLRTPGQTAEYLFNGQAGMSVVFDIAAREVASPLDAVMELYAPDGALLAASDDQSQELNIGPILQQFDPYIMITLPEDGVYKLKIFDRYNHGSSNHRYYLRFGLPKPDFQVYATTSSAVLIKGQSTKIKLKLQYQDNFKAPLTVRTIPPLTVTEKSAVIPAGATEHELEVFYQDKLKRPRLLYPELRVEAQVDNEPIIHNIIPADEYTQAFAHTHLLPAKRFVWLNDESKPNRLKSNTKTKKATTNNKPNRNLKK